MAARCVVVLVLSLALASCGPEGDQPGPGSGGAGGAREAVGGPPVDWERPFGNSPVVGSVHEAEQLVAFEVRKPAFGVEPSLIQVGYPTHVKLRERTVAFVYEFPGYGIVVVQERLSHFTQADLVARADEPSAPEEAFRMVRIDTRRGPVGALLTSSEGVGGLLWIEEGVLFGIAGPAASPEAVLSLGERL